MTRLSHEDYKRQRIAYRQIAELIVEALVAGQGNVDPYWGHWASVFLSAWNDTAMTEYGVYEPDVVELFEEVWRRREPANDWAALRLTLLVAGTHLLTIDHELAADEEELAEHLAKGEEAIERAKAIFARIH